MASTKLNSNRSTKSYTQSQSSSCLGPKKTRNLSKADSLAQNGYFEIKPYVLKTKEQVIVRSKKSMSATTDNTRPNDYAPLYQ